MLLSSLNRLYLVLELTKNLTTDIVLTNLLHSVSKNILNFLDRDIEIGLKCEYFDSIYKKQEYFVNAYPISSITMVQSDVYGDYNGDEYTYTTDQYRIGVNSDSIIIDNMLNSFEKGFKVIYTGGLASHATQSVFGIKNAVDGTMTVGNYVKGGISESLGKIIDISSTSLTVEIIAGEFQDEEVLTEYSTLGGTAGSKTVQIDNITSKCLAEAYSDIVRACEMQVRYEYIHRNNFENKEENSQNSGMKIVKRDYKGGILLPEVEALLQSYVRG